MQLRQRALLVAMSGYALDSFDTIMLSFLLPQITQSLHLTTTQSGALMTWTLMGGALGGTLFGIASDYFGRARILTITIAIFSFFTVLCAFSSSFSELLAWRVCAGIGLGCEFGLGMALVSEYYPASMLGRITSWVGMSWQFGVLAASLLTPFLLPYVGWRGMFIIGGAPAILTWFIRHSLPEPGSFQRRRLSDHGIFPLWALFANREMTQKSLAIICMSTIQNFGYYGLMVWLPSYLVNQFHMSLNLSGVWTAVTVCGMISGIWIFGQMTDRLGLKTSFQIYQIFAAISVGLYASLSTKELLLVAGFVAGIFVNGMMGGYGALITRLYPTAIRGTAQNVLWSIGRALGGLGPAIFGAVLMHTSYSQALLFLAAIYVLDFLVTSVFIPSRLNENRIS
ncbi:MAG: MFS transporter [Acetobacter sp.]